MKSETKRTILTVSVSVLGVIASIFVAQYTARSEFRNSLQDQVFEARLEHHKEMMEMTYELTKYAREIETMADVEDLGMRVNKWLYGEGGLYASVTTRGRVKWLRSELLNIQDGEKPEDVRKRSKKAVTCVITALRADLDLRGDLSVDRKYEATLNRFTFDDLEPEKNGSNCCKESKEEFGGQYKPPCSDSNWLQSLRSDKKTVTQSRTSGISAQP